MRRLALLLALLSTSCINDYLRPQMTATLVVADTCTSEQYRVIRSAALEWFHALPEAEAPIRQQRGNERPTVRCMPGEPPQRPGVAILGIATPGNMRIWADAAGPLLRGVALHEMGHYLGYDEGPNHPADAAALAGEKPAAWTCINPTDIESVCAARRGKQRGCKGITRPTCEREQL